MSANPQTEKDLNHVRRLIDGIPIAMLCTIESDNVLASRPMSLLEMDDAGALWFYTDVRSSKVEHLRVANLSFTDRNSARYVSLSGHGEIVTDRARIKALWTEFAKPWFPDGPDSPNLALLKFEPDTADYWDGPSSKMVRSASMIASIVAGKPVGLGEHGSLRGLSDPL